jgi:hypothetical protein
MPGILRVDQANVDFIYAKSAGSTVYVPGHIIQVVQAIKTDTFTSSTAETWTNITGMSATITPKQSTSKILVNVHLARVSGTNALAFRVLRDGNLYLAGDAAGSRPQLHFAESNQGRDTNHCGQAIHMYVDSPATTSTCTYQVQVRPEGTYFGLNRTANDTDSNNSYNGRSSSTLILMEIAQ